MNITKPFSLPAHTFDPEGVLAAFLVHIIVLNLSIGTSWDHIFPRKMLTETSTILNLNSQPK